MSVKLVNDATALLSMRESDFDTYSAYGEAIDNSIQANASKIWVDFETERVKGGFEQIKRVTFMDNGDGMDGSVIHHCLQLGYSSRFNDRSGIGRFGVGMTLGAIHECQRVDVYSRMAGVSEWLTTFIDLSHLSITGESSDVSIADPIEKEPDFIDISRMESTKGTVVSWSKYDRQMETASKIIEKTKVYIGRTFRKYLWDGVEIFVNGEAVFVIDPLYVNPEKTRYPEDKPAFEVDPIVVEWPVPEDIAEFDGQMSDVTIRLSLLPEFIRPNAGSGGAQETKNRYIHENQGISIMRHDREVFYGAIPYWPGDSKWFSEIDRWWGCEVSFDPLLDRAFTVKNIKRGAVPNKELKKVIYDQISPTVKNFLEEVRRIWAANKQKKEQEERDKDDVHTTGHEEAEEVVKKTPTDVTSSPVEDPEAAEKELLDRLNRERTQQEESAWITKWRSQPFTIEEDSWRGKEFIELKPLGGNDVLLYNTSHGFMVELQSIIAQLEEQEDGPSKDLAIKLKRLIDLLLISYTKAESKFADDASIEIFEMLRMNWGQYLKSYLKKVEGDE